MQIYGNKRKRLHKKRVQLPQDWFGTPTWLPFHCFGTPIWPPWRHVKTLHKMYIHWIAQLVPRVILIRWRVIYPVKSTGPELKNTWESRTSLTSPTQNRCRQEQRGWAIKQQKILQVFEKVLLEFQNISNLSGLWSPLVTASLPPLSKLIHSGNGICSCLKHAINLWWLLKRLRKAIKLTDIINTDKVLQ